MIQWSQLTPTGLSSPSGAEHNWISVTSGASGNGSGAVAINVASNSGAARLGTVSVANQQFTVSQAAYVVASVTLQFTNYLIYPVSISVNGTVVGSVNASSTTSWTMPAPPTLQASFTLVQPSPFGVPLGDPMVGYYNPITNPAGLYSFNITNQIGNQSYFVPLVTNTANSALLMDVNLGLAAENRCNCVVPAQGVSVAFGYYMLFSNSNVEAFRNGSGYTGNYYYFDNFTSLVGSQTGVLYLTFNQSP